MLNHDKIILKITILIKIAQHFANRFWALDGNILDARIFFSDLLKVNRTQKLTLRHFRNELSIVNKEKILALCLKHLINLAKGMMASWKNINNVCGFKLSDLERFHVRSLIWYAKAEFSININLETTQLATFVNRIKKGSKKYRKILSNEKVCLHYNKGLKKRLKLSTLTQPLELRDCNFYNLFRCGFLTNEFCEFLLKFNTVVF